MATNQFTKVGEGMRRNESSKTIYANFRHEGKTYRHSLETTDKTIARNTLAEFRKKLSKGVIQNQQNTTVAEIEPRFISSLATLADSSRIRAKGHMRFFVEEFGDDNPRDLKPMDLAEWLQELREEQEFGEDCFNKYATTLKQFYAFLIENSYASENPAMTLEHLKAKAVRKYTPSTEEVLAILDCIKNQMFFREKQETLDFIEFMALTGQGKAEAIHAQWMDISYGEKKINFYRQKTRAKAHTMPLFPVIAAFFKRRLNGRKPEATEPIFKIQSAKNAIKSACSKLGIPKLGHHSFRRYFITERLMEGVPPNIVAKWVGHHTSEMVMEIYSSIPNTFEVSFAEKIPSLNHR